MNLKRLIAGAIYVSLTLVSLSVAIDLGLSAFLFAFGLLNVMFWVVLLFSIVVGEIDF